MKTTSTFFPSNCCPGLQSHVGQALVSKPLSGCICHIRRIGHAALIFMPMPDSSRKVIIGSSTPASKCDRFIVFGAIVGRQLLSIHQQPYPHAGPCGAFSRPFRNAKVVSSGAIIPARAPPSIDMLQTVIRSSWIEPGCRSGVLEDVFGATAHADFERSVPRHDILCRKLLSAGSFHTYFAGFRFALQQALGG